MLFAVRGKGKSAFLVLRGGSATVQAVLFVDEIKCSKVRHSMLNMFHGLSTIKFEFERSACCDQNGEGLAKR